MKGRTRTSLAVITLLFALVLSLPGCGGGGGQDTSLPSVPGGGTDNPAETGTARFHVEVPTGQVSISALKAPGNRAVFAGSTVDFTSSLLLDQPGNVGRKALSVSLVNRSGETIGQMPDGTVTGLRVLFSAFTNVGAFSDLRPGVEVSTLAGSGAFGSTDGPAGSATLKTPGGIAADNEGNLYVAETGGHLIRKVSRGWVSTLAGSGVAGSTDGMGSAASFSAPYGVAVNPLDGALLVTDYTGNRVRRVEADGRVTLVAGTGAAGDTNGAGNSAYFRSPCGVTVDSSGVIYIAEYGGHRIRKLTLTGNNPRLASHYTVSVLAGNGTAGSTDGLGSGARFNLPRGIVAGTDGALYVADMGNHKIRRVSFTGEVVTIGGTGSAGATDGSGEAATFYSPFGIAWVRGALMVSDYGGQTLRQMRLKAGSSGPGYARNWLVQTLAGLKGSSGSADGSGVNARFYMPRLLAADGSGNLYVADGGNHKVRCVRPSSGMFPIGVATGSAPAEPVQLWNADGVIPNGDRPYVIYPEALVPGATTALKEWWFMIPEGVTAFEFTVTVEANTTGGAPPESVDGNTSGGVGSPKVMVRTLAGGSEVGFLDGMANQAKFDRPFGMALDNAGNLYIADRHNHAVRRINTAGQVSTVAGTVGKGSGYANGSGTQAEFYYPMAVAVTPGGERLYVTEFSNHLVRCLMLMPGTDPMNPENWYVSTIAGKAGTAGKTDGAGDVAQFAGPVGIALDQGGNLYVGEYIGNRVRRLQFKGGDPSLAANWQVSLVAGDNSATTGATGTTDGIGSAARFYNPYEIDVDRAGSLYVADYQNQRIRKITDPGRTSGGTVSTLAGSTAGYADGAALTAKFNLSGGGVGVDASGYVYVADSGNDRIRRISPGGMVTTVAGTGLPGGTDGRGDIATFNGPAAVTVDAAGNLYVAESTRIRIIQRVISAGQ